MQKALRLRISRKTNKHWQQNTATVCMFNKY
jgi:hypothetical protein